MAYTCNLVQRVFSDLVSALTVNTDARGLESNQTLFGGNQFTIAFALLDGRIFPVYTIKDPYEYIFLDFYHSNLSPNSTKKIAICPCCKKAFSMNQRNKLYCSKACKDKSIRANNKKNLYYSKYQYLQQYHNRQLNNMCRHMADSSPQAQKLQDAYDSWNKWARSEYKQVSSFSDHMQWMTVEEFGERLKEQWKVLMRDLK